jgi:hypothetical protein
MRAEVLDRFVAPDPAAFVTVPVPFIMNPALKDSRSVAGTVT